MLYTPFHASGPVGDSSTPLENRTSELGLVALRVRDAQGNMAIVTMPARSAQEAAFSAQARGLHLLAIETNRATTPRGSKRQEAGAPFPLLHFSQELLALLEAGLNLAEAMRTLLAKESRPEKVQN